MSKEYSTVGCDEIKNDVQNKAIGAAVYTTDITFPDMLTAKVIRSPYAHANILAIHKDAAMIPGIHAIITYEDVPQTRFSSAGYPKETIRGIVKNVPMDYLEDNILLETKVHYYGEPVAIVVGESDEIVDQAMKLVDIEYEELPASFDPDYSLTEEAPFIHPGTRKNVIDTEMGYGDNEKAFAQSDRIYEGTYETHPQQHVCMERSCTITKIDAAGQITMWSTTQVPYHIRRDISEVFDIPLSKIRVIKPALGGGFGERQMVQGELLCVAAALKVKHPVRLEMTREENLSYTSQRHPMRLNMKIGVTNEGKLKAMQLKVRSNAGAYTGHSPYVTKATCTQNPYKYDSVKFNAEIVYTNLPEFSAYRGYGNLQVSFARESLIDEIAHDMGIDGVKFRKDYVVQVGDANPVALQSDWILESCELGACLERGAEAIGWYKPRKKPQGSKYYGIGIGTAIHVTGTSAEPDFSSATVTMNEDGSIKLLIGSPDLGQGSDTALAQICAETVGVPYESVSVISADTDVTSFDMGSYSSRQTFVAGNAVKKAAEKVRKEILKFAAEMTGQQLGNLRTKDGYIVRRENGRKVAPIKDVAYFSMYLSKERKYISKTASYSSLNCPPAFAAHFAEVEVDIETGDIKVLNYVAAHDVGTAINPRLVEAQIEGCIGQGLGFALSENMTYDAKGKLEQNSYADYKVPRALDMPKTKIIIVDSYEPSGPYGAKSVAEMAIAPVPVAIANAVYVAIGVRVKKLPMTKDRMLAMIQEHEREG